MSTEDEYIRKGYMSSQPQVTCGGCLYWVNLTEPRYSQRVKEAKTLGYHYSRKRGWLCDKCYRELRGK